MKMGILLLTSEGGGGFSSILELYFNKVKISLKISIYFDILHVLL